MTPIVLLEVVLSLALQVTVLILLAARLLRARFTGVDADKAWAVLHAAILAMTVAGVLLPHVRLITWAGISSTAIDPTAEFICAALGRSCGWIWLVGTVTIFVLNIAGWVRASLWVRRSRPADHLNAACLEIAKEANLAAMSVEVRISPINVSPFCWQIHRPIIVLPAIVQNFPLAEQTVILRHELAHLRRHHPVQLFLQRITEALYWFNPLIWRASSRAAAAREIRCDCDAVTSKSQAADYLRSLLRLIEMKTTAPERLPAGLGYLGEATFLSERAKRLADRQSFESPPSDGRRATLLIWILACACSLMWLPVNPGASRRSDWSPWPVWTAKLLDATGVEVRDYEVDGHRLNWRENIR